MKIDRQPDGSLVIRENPALLRGILICLGATVVAAVALQEPRDDLRLFLGALGSLVPLADAIRAVLGKPSRAPVQDGTLQLMTRRPSHR